MVPVRPLRHPGFRRLAASYTLNELGWGFATVALGLLVFDHTGSALATTALWVCTLLIPALVGPAATAQLDRAGVRRVLPALYLAEAAIFVALALLASAPWLPLVLLLAAVDGVLALVGRALTRAAVAATLKPDGQLEAGNTLLNVSFSLCFAIGPALGGLMVAGFGVAAALWVSAAIFLAMTVTLATSRSLPPAHADAGEGWLTRLRAGLGHALGNRAVRRILFAHAGALTCAAMISPVEVIWAKEVIGGGNGAYGVVLSAWGAGTLVTGLALVGLWRRIPVVTRIPLAAGTMGAGYVVMALATSLPVGARRLLHRRHRQRLLLRVARPGRAGPHGRRVPGPRHGPAGVDHRRVLRRRLPARRRADHADFGARHLRRHRGRRDRCHHRDGDPAAREPADALATMSLAPSPPSARSVVP